MRQAIGLFMSDGVFDKNTIIAYPEVTLMMTKTSRVSCAVVCEKEKELIDTHSFLSLHCE